MSKLTILLVTVLGLAALFCTLLIESDSTGLRKRQSVQYNNAWVKLHNPKADRCICTEPLGTDMVGDDQYSYACGCNEPDTILFYFENTQLSAAVLGGKTRYTKFWVKAAHADKKATFALQVLPRNTLNGAQFRKFKGSGDDGQRWYVVTDYQSGTISLRNVFRSDLILNLAGPNDAPGVINSQAKAGVTIPDTARWKFIQA